MRHGLRRAVWRVIGVGLGKRWILVNGADVSSLSFSPSIKFIDASSSYELVSDSETDTEKNDTKEPLR